VAARSILQVVDRPGRIIGGQIIFRPSRAKNGSEFDLLGLSRNGDEMRAVRGGSISMIFQEPMSSFSPVHTFGNQIIETIRLHRDLSLRDARALAVEWLKRVGMPNPERRLIEYPHQLSGGQRQRAMIAMALATNPELLIADEPTTALDVTTQAQILDLLRRLRDESGMAIMFITHDLGVVAEMADEVAIMYLGRVVEHGKVEAIFHDPRHPYTRALLASIPSMQAKSRQRLPPIVGAIPHPYNRPPGCPFHPRCPSYISGTCEVRAPNLVQLSPGHGAACHLYEGA
jgi:oligopeptide/dipeptide ABC transporter ATP-binding protein